MLKEQTVHKPSLWLAQKDKSARGKSPSSGQGRTPDLRLFCFPYAGGGASVYRGWQELLPENIQVCRVQLPGRENRILEPPRDKLLPLVRECVEHLLPFMEETKFALYGHSMGSYMAFEVAREIRRRTGQLPLHLFIGACNAPQISQPPPRYDLPDHLFINALRKLGGTPDEVLEDSSLMGLFLPLLRADYALKEAHVYQSSLPFACPVTAFGGVDDEETTPGGLEAWKEHASSFSLIMLEGGHFFLKSHQRHLVSRIGAILASQI